MLALIKNSLPLIQDTQKADRKELEAELKSLKSRHENPLRQQQIKRELSASETGIDTSEEGLDFIAEFMGIRLKVLPNRAMPDRVFVCNCDPSLFLGSLDFLKQQYGANIEGPWVVLGQVNVPVLGDTTLIPIGNQLDQIFEELFIPTENEFLKLSGVSFPAISFNPICVYRETAQTETKE